VTEATERWLRDVETLRAFPQRYSRAIDARDIEAVGELFDPDGVVDGALGTLPVPQYLGGLRAAPRSFATSMHVLGEPLIEFEPGTDVATMDTYALVYQLDRVAEPSGDVLLGIRYLDDLVRINGAWKIHHRRAVMLWTR
jgi:SnoaL-like domain